VRKGAQPRRMHAPIITIVTNMVFLMSTSLLWIFSDLQVDLVRKDNW
jgi:hypothetical protein